MPHVQNLSKNNIHHTAAASTYQSILRVKHLSGSGEPAEWQIVPHERYKPETPVRRYVQYQESEQGDDPEVLPARFALDIRECERPGDANGRCKGADEDEARRRHA